MLTVKDLEKLVGKKLNDPTAQKVFAKIPGRSKRVKDGDQYDHTYRDYGLGLVEQLDSRVSTVFLYAKDRSIAEYQGEMPEGLTMKMTYDEVLAKLTPKLGEPDKEWEFMLQWDRGLYRLSVNFERKKISTISLSAM
jgi:hypothetical protein